jgi:hypothetical protein
MHSDLPILLGAPDQWNLNTVDYYDLPEVFELNHSLYVGREGGERTNRTIIYPKDVEMIYDQPESFAREVLKYIRLSLGHSLREPVTVGSFSDFSGIDVEIVLLFIEASCFDKHFLYIENLVNPKSNTITYLSVLIEALAFSSPN